MPVIPFSVQWYCYGYGVYNNWLFMGIFDPWWGLIDSTSSYPIHTNTIYDLTVIGNNTHYMAYVNDLLVFEFDNPTHFTNGTFGVRSWQSAVTFHSLVIEPYNRTTQAPTRIPSDIPSNMPSNKPTMSPSDWPSRVASRGPSTTPTLEPSATTIAPSVTGDGEEENNNDNNGSGDDLGTFETIVIILLCGICFLFITLNIAAFWCVWMKKRQSQELSQIAVLNFAKLCHVQGY